MVTITTSYTITPNEPTPRHHMWLSDSDQIVHFTHARTIYIYKANPNFDVIERMRESLSKILVHYYPIAGRLRWVEGGRLELECNAKGVTLLEAESTKTSAEYGDFSPNGPIKDLLPKVDYTQPIEELPLLLVQLTRFHGNEEGIAIGLAFSHPLADGFGAIRFINAWAKVARRDTLDHDEMFPTLDRSILRSSYSPSSARFDHPELQPLPLKLGNSDHTAEQKKKIGVVTMKLTTEQVEQLKKKANDQFQKQGSRPYTRFEAIAAYIWQCASKARRLDDLQPTRVRFMVDIRNRLSPPLPLNYFGNALAPTVSPTCFVGDIISKPLSYAAQKIREAVELIKNDYVWSQQDCIRGQDQLDGIRFSLQYQGERRNNAPFYGNPNINIVSWMSMPVYEADFGWGKPMHFGPGDLRPFDMAYLIRSPDGDGSIIVTMFFQEAHIQLFTKFFREDIC